MRFKEGGLGYLGYYLRLTDQAISEINPPTKEGFLQFLETRVVPGHGTTITEAVILEPGSADSEFRYPVCATVYGTQCIIGWVDTPWDDTAGSRWRAEGKEDPHGNRYHCARHELCMGNLTDDELANEMFLYDHRTGLKSMSYLTAAKERIRWLSRKLAAAEQQLREATDQRGIDGGYKKFEIQAKDVPWARFDDKEECDG